MSLSNPILRDTRERFLTVGAGQSAFGPIDFKIFDPLDVVIWSRVASDAPWVPVAGAIVTLTGAAPSTFSFTKTGLTAGTQLRVRGARTEERITNVTRSGSISSQALERQLDVYSIILQELRRDSDLTQEAYLKAVEALEVANGLLDEIIPAGSITEPRLANQAVSVRTLAANLIPDALGFMPISAAVLATAIGGLAAVASSGSAADLSGTLPDALLTSNVAMRNAANTFTENQRISRADAFLDIMRPTTSGDSGVAFYTNNVADWVTANLNSTSNFGVLRFVGGVYQDTPFQINKNTGQVTIGNLNAPANNLTGTLPDTVLPRRLDRPAALTNANDLNRIGSGFGENITNAPTNTGPGDWYHYWLDGSDVSAAWQVQYAMHWFLKRKFRRTNDGNSWSGWDRVLETEPELDARYFRYDGVALETSLDGSADRIPIWDASVGAFRLTSPASIAGTNTAGVGSVVGASGTVSLAQLAAGGVIVNSPTSDQNITGGFALRNAGAIFSQAASPALVVDRTSDSSGDSRVLFRTATANRAGFHLTGATGSERLDLLRAPSGTFLSPAPLSMAVATGNLTVTADQDTNGRAFYINKHSSPLNYAADTRAAMVMQHRDTASLGSNAQTPSVMFDMTVTGNGSVVAAADLSTSIWWGVTAFMKKSGDGSAHSFTVGGELGAVGPGGYNEFGGIQGEMTNVGSTRGTMSGVEFLMKDSPNGGVNSYDTKIDAILGRVARYHNSTRGVYNFSPSSEGLVAVDAMFGVRTGGLRSWVRGWDMIGADGTPAIFTTGQFIRAPNNTSIAWRLAGGATAAVLGVSSADVLFLKMTQAGSPIQLQDHAGVVLLEAINANDAVAVRIGGALRYLGKAANNSAGAGFSNVIIANV